MNLEDFKKLHLPDGPGVYFFKNASGIETLYIGKATSLRDRVRSYFNDDLIKTRGRLLVDMVAQASTIAFQETDSVLEAFILESELIKQYLPRYNTKEKDNKSFNYVVMTKEDFPRVLVVRGRNLEKAGSTKQEQVDALGFEYTDVFGPFPFGAELKEAMKLIRRIFPFRDKCEPFVCVASSGESSGAAGENIGSSAQKGIQISPDGATLKNTYMKGKPCFNRSIGLCPGVCTGEISKEEYAAQIGHIRKFFKGKKQAVMDDLKQEMLALAKDQKFEEANDIKKTLNALVHIHDISMIKKDAEFGYVGARGGRGLAGGKIGMDSPQDFNFIVRAEAYDIAHMSGKDMIGVMVVMQDGDFAKDQYKKFNIREIKSSNDTGALKQVLERRFSHADWALPTHIVLDGGAAQMNAAEEVLKNISGCQAGEADMSGESGVADEAASETASKAGGDRNRLQKIKNITLVAVTKDDKHKAKSILRSDIFKGAFPDASGAESGANTANTASTTDAAITADTAKTTNTANTLDAVFDDGDIISINQECHRFAISTHRKRRSLSRGL
jgi:excinuclease UvrABC nuclease subunit